MKEKEGKERRKGRIGRKEKLREGRRGETKEERQRGTEKGR